jgi:hypothetical protein
MPELQAQVVNLHGSYEKDTAGDTWNRLLNFSMWVLLRSRFSVGRLAHQSKALRSA